MFDFETHAKGEPGFSPFQTTERIGENGGEHGTAEIGQINRANPFRERPPEPHRIQPNIYICYIDFD